jgi:hypothetical protein
MKYNYTSVGNSQLPIISLLHVSAAWIMLHVQICVLSNFIASFIHSFIYLHSIDHTDVEFVIKYKFQQNIKLYTIHVRMEHRFKTFLYISTPTMDEPKALYNLIQI